MNGFCTCDNQDLSDIVGLLCFSFGFGFFIYLMGFFMVFVCVAFERVGLVG